MPTHDVTHSQATPTGQPSRMRRASKRDRLQDTPEHWQSKTPIPCVRCHAPTRDGIRFHNRLLCPLCAIALPHLGHKRVDATLRLRPRALNANGQRRLCGARWRTITRPGILARDGMRCMWAILAHPFTPACSTSNTFTADHIIPWSAGTHDEHDPTNLLACCTECNQARKDARVSLELEQVALYIAQERTRAMPDYRW